MENMTKATIKTKSGTEIIIESDRKTIEEIVFALQRREDLKEKFKEEITKRKENISTGTKPQTATDAILKLKIDGFFKSRKSLSEIQVELERAGHIYPNTSLSPILLRLVRRGELGRIRDEKNWSYAQR